MSVEIRVGDALTTLREMPEQSVRCCVTSPPYWGLRDYGVEGQLGLESTPDEYVAKMVEVFREVRRVLADDGTLWLNLGDSYASFRDSKCVPQTVGGGGQRSMPTSGAANRGAAAFAGSPIKSKDLVGIPWRVAFALQADGWYLRSDIIWSKPNPMPESVTDRPTKAHEYVFLLSKRERYFYDAAAIAEPTAKPEYIGKEQARWGGKKAIGRSMGRGPSGNEATDAPYVGAETRNARSVWEVSTRSFSGAHFATMPPELAERCVKAGSAVGDTILDPFGGAGTTGLVADRLQRNAILCELNPEYAAMARERIKGDNPLFAEVATA